MSDRKIDPVILAPRLALNILHIEDNSFDAALCLRALQKAQMDISVDLISTPEELHNRLESPRYDVILSDYNLGRWNGMDALQIIREKGVDSPFILVTGALGEQKAVECVRSGVSDYILKDRLERLPVAIFRAVEEKGMRSERELLQRSLSKSEAKFRALCDALPTAIFIEKGTSCYYVNRAAQALTGYTRQELLASCFWQLLVPSSRGALLQETLWRFGRNESVKQYDVQILTKRDKLKSLNLNVEMFPLDGEMSTLITALELGAFSARGALDSLEAGELALKQAQLRSRLRLSKSVG